MATSKTTSATMAPSHHVDRAGTTDAGRADCTHAGAHEPLVTVAFSVQLSRLFTEQGFWHGLRPRGELAALLADTHLEIGTQTGAFIYEVPADRIQPLLELTRSIHASMSAARRSQPDAVVFTRWIKGLSERAVKAVEPVPAKPVQLFAAAPTGRKARQAYTRHVMACVRDLVNYTQTADYIRAQQ